MAGGLSALPSLSITLFDCIFNSVYFISPNITNSEFPSEGFTICTDTTSLTFDLTSDQEELPINKTKVKNPSG